VATEALVLSLTARIVFRDLGWWVGAERFLRGLGAAAAMALLVWGVRQAGAPLAVLTVAALIAYPLLLLVVRAVRLSEVTAILRRQVA
jgi:hypothetical protein